MSGGQIPPQHTQYFLQLSPSAHIPALLAEDTAHSRRANKPDPPPGLCKDGAQQETLCAVCRTYSNTLSAGQDPGLLPQENQGIEELQGSLEVKVLPFPSTTSMEQLLRVVTHRTTLSPTLGTTGMLFQGSSASLCTTAHP